MQTQVIKRVGGYGASLTGPGCTRLRFASVLRTKPLQSLARLRNNALTLVMLSLIYSCSDRTKPASFQVSDELIASYYSSQLTKYNTVVEKCRDSLLAMIEHPNTYQSDKERIGSWMNEQWSDRKIKEPIEFEMVMITWDFETELRSRIPKWLRYQDSIKKVGFNVIGYRCGFNFWCASDKLDTMFNPFVEFRVDTSLNIIGVKSEEFTKYGKRLLKEK